MKIGMVGLPNVGKSTLFNAVAGGGAQSANYPFCTIEPNRGTVSVPDTRLERLRDEYAPDKFTPAVIEFMDIAGLVKGASKGEGLGNKFLADIRESDALIHVVRCFDNDNIVHVEGGVDPVRDIETIDIELICSDLELLERRLDRIGKALKAGDKSAAAQAAVVKKMTDALSGGINARDVELTEAEREIAADIPLLSAKPVIYAANLDEAGFKDYANNKYYRSLYERFAAKSGNTADVFPVCAQVEAELAELDDSDRAEFFTELGLTESALGRLIRECYRRLGLISYFTAGKQEVRAWTIKNGTKAPQAAGKIHTDFEKGFIRAEVAAYDDLLDKSCPGDGDKWRGMAAAKEKGLVRLEGKDYVMKDGDVVLFRFNV